MLTALQPMNTGELLDRSFNLYRNNFPLFAGISALAAIILVAGTVLLTLLGTNVGRVGRDFRALGGMAIYSALFGLFYLFGASLAIGATIYAVSKVHLGQPVTIGESYNKVFPWLGRIIRIVFIHRHPHDRAIPADSPRFHPLSHANA